MLDIAAIFKEALTYMPLEALEEIRRNLEVNGNGSAAVQKAILSTSIEILRRKWGVVERRPASDVGFSLNQG